ncbi:MULTISPECIES: hypothetical protein [Streptomyces]|uniref:Lipoprotein n=1 Tax=Streptomyces pseudovenezuelae TaxID=67350 RepID=A0A101N968_9ACTN|nr:MULTISPECIES: hypothetical protein [Streptomyces]KUM88804.1 hypothetical protein AQI94_09615 [Streptomyces pseudovenezuelae]
MKRSSTVRAGVTATVGMLSLALVTGCGGGSDSDAKASGSPRPSQTSASPTTAGAKALGAAELEKLLLVQSDLPRDKIADGDDTLPRSRSELQTDKPACAPLAFALTGLPPGDSDAGASNTVTSEERVGDSFDVTMTSVGLSSYEGDGARQALKAVSDGIAPCSGGFAITAKGEKMKITKVAAGKPTGVGDESVAFVLDADMDGEGTGSFTVEVVRVGSLVSTYYAVDFASMQSGTTSAVPLPVIDTQVRKLK